MNFSNKWLKQTIDEDCVIENDNPLEFIEQSQWSGDGGKYEFKYTIFKFEGRFYRVTESRTGSYYSDYYYSAEDWRDDGEQECKEVKKIAVTEYKWVPVYK